MRGIKGIFDAGHDVFDRYTVVYDSRNPRNGMYEMLAMNSRPFHPQGFGQHVEGQYGRHLGKRISFQKLPYYCQRVVIQDLKAYGFA